MPEQPRYELALHGHGLIPGLLCLDLLRVGTPESILLLVADAAVGGDALEPVTVSSLSKPALDLVADFAVAHWPGYFVIRNGQTHEHADPVLLLDPVQLRLELGARLGERDQAVGVTGLVHSGSALAWPSGSAEAADLVDLCALTRSEHHAEIVGDDMARSLPLPVLADFDTGDEPWDAFQHVPLGDERVYVRKRRCRGNAEFELTSGFGKLLSDLVAY